MFFLIFEDNSSEEQTVIKKCVENANDFDYVAYLARQGIERASEYYDANRMMKIRDKMSAPTEVGHIVEKVVERLKRVSRR